MRESNGDVGREAFTGSEWAWCPKSGPTEFRLELAVSWSLPAELVTLVCVEVNTPVAQVEVRKLRCSQCVWPSCRPSITAQQPAESFVSDHHITHGFLGGARRGLGVGGAGCLRIRRPLRAR